MAGSAGSVDRKKLISNGREEENRKGKKGAKVEQMDPDTFQMSPAKRAFTIEHDCVNANAPGCRSLLIPSFSSVFFTLLTHPQCLSLFVMPAVIGFSELFSSSLFTSSL